MRETLCDISENQKLVKNISKILVLLFLSICGCKSKNPDSNNSVELAVDSSKIAILQNDIFIPYLIPKDAKYSSLNENEILEIEKILKESVHKYNLEAKKQFEKLKSKNLNFKPKEENFIINLDEYRRQYVGYENKKGEKEVWINCFCSKNEKWKIEPILVNDGGNCYFNLKVNLSNKIYFDFYVNGDA